LQLSRISLHDSNQELFLLVGGQRKERIGFVSRKRGDQNLFRGREVLQSAQPIGPLAHNLFSLLRGHIKECLLFMNRQALDDGLHARRQRIENSFFLRSQRCGAASE
jgi:hypothetical protein